MSEEEFGWIPRDEKMWSAEEDIRWCGNLALGCAAFIMLAGVVFGGYAASPIIKCYTITAAMIFGAIFGAIGIWTRWHIHQKTKRTTIKRPEGWRK